MQPYNLIWDHECDGSIISVAATSNCSTISVATVGRSLYLFDGDGKPLWKMPYKTDNEAWATAISEDAQYVAVGTANKNPADGSIFVLDPLMDKRLLRQHGKIIYFISIAAPDRNISRSQNAKSLVAMVYMA